MKLSILALTVALGLGACDAYAAGHSSAPAIEVDGILTNADGMSLYTFDPDTATTSACNGGCAKSWPPLAAGEGAHDAGDFTVITRDDGTTQWAYQGQPLYLWINDRKPGDTTGDGVGGKWHLARP